MLGNQSSLNPPNQAVKETLREPDRAVEVVFSTELESVGHGARLARGDVSEELAKLRKEFSGDMEVGGPTLAAQFIERGLVDVYRLVVHPVILGGAVCALFLIILAVGIVAHRLPGLDRIRTSAEAETEAL